MRYQIQYYDKVFADVPTNKVIFRKRGWKFLPQPLLSQNYLKFVLSNLNTSQLDYALL